MTAGEPRGERYRLTLRLKPPTLIQRLWYWRIRATPPLAVSTQNGEVARLVPHGFRRFHQWYAESRGFFWLPCPLCAQPFGGHESGKGVPDPLSENHSFVICPSCSRGSKLK